MSIIIEEVGVLDNIFKRKSLKNGINIYIHSTSKFKTITFYLFIHQNLARNTATKTALLPFVLKRGSKSFPTSRKFNLFLEDLYGTTIGGDILKRGEIQIVQFFMEIVNDNYIPGGNILTKALTAFRDMILDPVVEGGAFKKSYVDQEKDVLKRNIESLYNDKFNYVIERCFQEMCKDEAFSIYRYGNVEDLDFIDNENLYSFYRECLSSCPIDFFVLGDVYEDEIARIIEDLFTFERKDAKQVKTNFVTKFIQEPNYAEEKQDVNQGKLTMGFRTNTKYSDEDYYSLMVYNGILGGGSHSKLFQNVREKASLAYYAFSRLEKNKGLMIVSSGIDFDDRERAIEIINQQLEDIREGKISDYEFDSTIKCLVNSFKEAADNPAMIISLYLDGILNGVQRSTKEIIENLYKVTKTDVVNVAERICLDTVFFLNKK
ncbi:MAG: pitrilysin family protein [Tepidanaerobacteraceae bacterium]|jgi:predicted Zn-dependent peptidase|nr:insulinase family protein [Tepidanaerobacter sp.]